MAKFSGTSTVSRDLRAQASVLDRLLDDAPGNTRDAVISRAQSLQNFRAAVRRDLEALLNTRCTVPDMPPDMEEVGNSVYTYGLPDLSSFTAGSAQDRAKLMQAVRVAIERFEPRLANVEVEAGDETATKLELRFSISALLLSEPVAEQVVFDTILESMHGRYQVRSD
ncbi:MAG: type VI secretion system baseplate subunit TssE [Bryobacteraceae bacterium]